MTTFIIDKNFDPTDEYIAELMGETMYLCNCGKTINDY